MLNKRKNIETWDDYALEEIKCALAVCHTVREICLFLNIEDGCITRKHIADLIKRHNLPSAGIVDLDKKPQGRPPVWTFDEVFKKGSKAPPDVLLRMVTLFGLFPRKCERCGKTHWDGEPIPLEIHHKNGDNTDNRIVNLSQLCCNCHALTDNWRGKQNKKVAGDEYSEPDA